MTMTVKTIVRWEREHSNEERAIFYSKLDELTAAGATNNQVEISDGAHSDTANYTRFWNTRADAEAWINFLNTTYTPGPVFTEIIEG